MAYDTFKPEFWASHYETELGKICRLVPTCDTQYEGDVEYGKSVRILGVSPPSITEYTGDAKEFETPPDISTLMPIDQKWSTAFKVDDVDKAQSVPGLLEALTKESIRVHAEKRDSVIAALAANAVYKSSDTSSVDTSTEAIPLVNAAFELLWDNGVSLESEMDLFVPPFFYTLIKDYIIEYKNINDNVITSGVVGKYNNANVIITNNLYKDDSGYYKIMLKTRKAIAFAAQVKKVEKTRLTPTGVMSDAIMTLDVFGAKIVRPDQLYVISAKKD